MERNALIGQMRATPRNALMGTVADALGAVDRFANMPDKEDQKRKANALLSFLSNAVGVGDLAATADRMSYGHDLTRGAGMARQMLPETANSLMTVGPMAAKYPLAASKLAMGAMGGGADVAMGAERGMISIPGRGKVPESRADVNRLSDRFGKLLDDAGVEFNHEKSALSPARYFMFDNPRNPDELLKVRISDHRDVRGGNTYSVDPTAGTTFEEMLGGLRQNGLSIADRAKPPSRKIMDDDTLQRIWGLSIDELQARGLNIDALKSRYVWSNKYGGHWTEKPD